MSTIKDVASLANVSIATVSRVLNGTGNVNPEREARVKRAIEKLGYQPNEVARNLRRSENTTIGIAVPDTQNPYFAEIAKGVEDACFEKGFTVVLCNTNESGEKAITHLNALYQQRASGFIVASPIGLNGQLQKLLDDQHPLVLADRPAPNLKTDSVVADNYGGAQQATRHLLDLGHERIGVVLGDLELETIKARWAGVRETLMMAGLMVEESLVYGQGDYTPRSGYAGAEALLNQPNPPTAIFAFNDLMALGVLNYAQSHGWPVPERLSVIGFDDIEIAAYATPSLTTVAQPKYELGWKAAEILLQRIGGSQHPPVEIVLPTKLMVRDSTERVTI